jgi:hypothetical protein
VLRGKLKGHPAVARVRELHNEVFSKGKLSSQTPSDCGNQ